LEEHERKLAVHAVNIRSFVPIIPDSNQNYCLPDCNERALGWVADGYHYISVPYFKLGDINDFIRLPFKEPGCYPEVEQSFIKLRAVYEEVIKEAYGWEPISCQGELNTSTETKKHIAAKLTAGKMLAFCGA
jgi:hypothetical protein